MKTLECYQGNQGSRIESICQTARNGITGVARMLHMISCENIPTDEAIRWQSLRSSPRTGKPFPWQREADQFECY